MRRRRGVRFIVCMTAWKGLMFPLPMSVSNRISYEFGLTVNATKEFITHQAPMETKRSDICCRGKVTDLVLPSWIVSARLA